MPWGTVTITYAPTGYTQNYKRNNVVTHVQCNALVNAAVADSVGRLPAGAVVGRNHIAQNLPADPGANYRPI
jgi:hypothetical protein